MRKAMKNKAFFSLNQSFTGFGRLLRRSKYLTSVVKGPYMKSQADSNLQYRNSIKSARPITEAPTMARNLLDYSGVISSTTPDGCSAFVKLDQPISGRKYVVISHDTVGRIKVMNGVGRLQPNKRVSGKATIGPEALSATTVEAA